MLPTESTVVGLVPDIPWNELCKVFDLAIGNKRVLKATSFVHALDCICLPMNHVILPFSIYFLLDNLVGVAVQKEGCMSINEKGQGRGVP